MPLHDTSFHVLELNQLHSQNCIVSFDEGYRTTQTLENVLKAVVT
jgi:hypothetical protein